MNWGLILKLMIRQGRYKCKRDDYDHDLGHDYDNGFDLDQYHLQDIDTTNNHHGDECFRSMSSLFWQMLSL